MIFKPGIYLNPIDHILHMLLPNMTDIPLMHKIGYVIVKEDTYHINRCLFDSGALSDNYISQTFVDANADIFKDYILESKSTVKLGDSKTTVNITHIVTLEVSFQDTNNATHQDIINFSIMPMSHLDMIIGIHSIIFSFFDLFLDMLRAAKKKMFHNHDVNAPEDLDAKLTLNHILDMSSEIPTDNLDYEKCIPTWSFPLMEIAPEEEDTYDPCAFTLPLYVLQTERQVALDEYYALLKTNIYPELIRARPDLLEFMMSDIALKVFVPSKWTGINGLDPLELEFQQLPFKLTPHMRRVRPEIMQTVKTEFDRLRTYMFVPSISSIASPLVIAPKATFPWCRLVIDFRKINRCLVFRQNYTPVVLDELQRCKKT
jgi:hypothetical protein